jgi:hypothetical protein
MKVRRELVCITTVLVAGAAQTASAGIVGFVGDSTLAGGWDAFEAAQPHGPMELLTSGGVPDFTSVGSIFNGSGSVTLSPSHEKRTIPGSWGSWSHGYSGELFWTVGATSATYTMSAGVGSFDGYIEPNPFGVHTFSMTGTGSDGSSDTISVSAEGLSGASHFGFYSTGGAELVDVTISGGVDWAVAEMRIALVPAPGVLAAFGLLGLAGARRRRD